MRPLYQDHAEPNLSATSGNTGLWYDKFCDQWSSDWDIESKLEWIKKITGSIGGAQLINEAISRAIRLIDASDGQFAIYKTDGRFVTGLGRDHPVENDFAWHHTLGTAYLPGTSVKGLVRAWATPDSDLSDLDRIFGPRGSGDIGVGDVVFLDALPSSPLKLEADVMTPHYAPYYEDKTGGTPPADWHDPRPIPFLVVAPEQSFLFALLPRNSNDQQHRQDCQTVAGWLAEALDWLGAGAKTAVGYGRFTPNQQMQRVLHDRLDQENTRIRAHRVLERRLAGLSALAAEFLKAADDQGWETNKDAFMANGVVEAWLDKIEATPHRDAIDLLDALIRKHFPPGLLDYPDRISGKKQRPDFKERQRRIAHRLNRL